jgi:putrescine transport system ATP-binding protein
VADFIGDVNLLEGVVQGPDASAVVVMDGSGQRFRFSPSEGVSSGTKVSIAIRPEKLSIAASQPGTQENCLSGTVSDIAYRGNALLYRVRTSSGAEFKVSVMNTRRLAGMPVGKGDPVWLTFAPEAGVVLRD